MIITVFSPSFQRKGYMVTVVTVTTFSEKRKEIMASSLFFFLFCDRKRTFSIDLSQKWFLAIGWYGKVPAYFFIFLGWCSSISRLNVEVSRWV